MVAYRLDPFWRVVGVHWADSTTTEPPTSEPGSSSSSSTTTDSIQYWSVGISVGAFDDCCAEYARVIQFDIDNGFGAPGQAGFDTQAEAQAHLQAFFDDPLNDGFNICGGIALVINDVTIEDLTGCQSG